MHYSLSGRISGGIGASISTTGRGINFRGNGTTSGRGNIANSGFNQGTSIARNINTGINSILAVGLLNTMRNNVAPAMQNLTSRLTGLFTKTNALGIAFAGLLIATNKVLHTFRENADLQTQVNDKYIQLHKDVASLRQYNEYTKNTGIALGVLKNKFGSTIQGTDTNLFKLMSNPQKIAGLIAASSRDSSGNIDLSNN